MNGSWWRRGFLLASLLGGSCEMEPAEEAKLEENEVQGAVGGDPEGKKALTEAPGEIERWRSRREDMVDSQLRTRGIRDTRVLAVMKRVPRHLFVPPGRIPLAYEDSPLPIGEDQTISQPYIVGLMTELAEPGPGEKALDVGTGSGYQAAVLSELVQKVYSIEIRQSLADSARDRLAALGYSNVEVRCGDGWKGWPEQAPFDVIILAAAPGEVPQALVDQLATGGRLVLPVGQDEQDLLVISKGADGSIERRSIIPVRFVPMVGEALEKGRSRGNGKPRP